MNTTKTDIATVIGKGLLGAIPFVGPLAAEIIGAVIPNQRIDRIESFLKILESKIDEKEKVKIKERIFTPESIDLIEDCFIQASRALSEERNEYIASLLKNGLTDEDLKYIEYKRLLFILEELNDIEVIILKSYVISSKSEYYELHKNILTEPLATEASAQDVVDKLTIYRTHREHLTNLGLLKTIFDTQRSPKFDKNTGNFESPEEFPIFDKSIGMFKIRDYKITVLGELLLRSIGLK